MALRPKIRAVLPLVPDRFGRILVFHRTVDGEERLTLQMNKQYRKKVLGEQYDPEYRREVIEIIVETFALNLRTFGGSFTRDDLAKLFDIKRDEAKRIETFIITETDRFEINPRRKQIITARLSDITNGLLDAAETALEDLRGMQNGSVLTGFVSERGGKLAFRRRGQMGMSAHLDSAASLATRLSKAAMEAVRLEMELDRRTAAPSKNDEGESPADALAEQRKQLLEEAIVRVIGIEERREARESGLSPASVQPRLIEASATRIIEDDNQE